MGCFFEESKTLGKPLAESDVTKILDDIYAEGFNIVNVDYAFVPDYLFQIPIIQDLAFEYIMNHLDLDNIVIMSHSARAIMTSIKTLEDKCNSDELHNHFVIIWTCSISIIFK